MRKRVTTITVESERVIEIRWQGRRREGRCERCGIEARLLTPSEAAVVAGVSQPTVLGWVESGLVHLTESADGPLVCLDSLGLPASGRMIEWEGDKR